MPRKSTLERARTAKRAGKSPSTQAGEFVREEMDHIREGKHGARSTKQAIAIGLSKARRAGVPLRPSKSTSPKTRTKARRDLEVGRRAPSRKASPRRSAAVEGALQREGHGAASHDALAKQARQAARRKTPAQRSATARKTARSRTPEERSEAGKKAAATRKRRQASASRG